MSKNKEIIKKVIFNKNGRTSVLIVDEGYIISNIKKEYIGYVDKDRIYDFNGNQRAWFKKGFFFDLYGKRIGFTENARKYNADLPKTKVSNIKLNNSSYRPLKPGSPQITF